MAQARGVACRAGAASTTPAEVAAVGVGEELPEGYEQMTPIVEASQRRRAGVLLHPTSLRGPHGIGDLGDQALAFLEWLREAGCTLWQVTSDAHFRPRPVCQTARSLTLID
jgi:4-alpha-glucanotransferase